MSSVESAGRGEWDDPALGALCMGSGSSTAGGQDAVSTSSPALQVLPPPRGLSNSTDFGASEPSGETSSGPLLDRDLTLMAISLSSHTLHTLRGAQPQQTAGAQQPQGREGLRILLPWQPLQVFWKGPTRSCVGAAFLSLSASLNVRKATGG